MDDSARFISRKFDRVVFGTYFLGAVGPLVALAVLAQIYVVPILENQSIGVSWLIGMMLAIGVLSLSCFFALRQITHKAIQRMDADNVRLTKLLRMSRELSNAPHADVVAETAAQSALSLLNAQAAFVLIRSEASKELALSEVAGDFAQDIYSAHEGLLHELVETAHAQGGVASLSSAAFEESGSKQPLSTAAAITLPGEECFRGALIVVHSAPGHSFTSSEIDSVSTLSSLTAVALENAHLQDTQRNFFAHVTEILVAALDEQVDCRKGHATRVAQLSNRLGRELGLDTDFLQRLHFASLLHDIGMLKIDRNLQLEPSHFRKHATIGYRMLSRIRLWEDLAPIVHYHHEFFDGSGYPEGLAGEQIPLEARVILVADAFDAMARPENGRSLEVIVSEFRECAGSQFDPAVVEALLALVERGEISCEP